MAHHEQATGSSDEWYTPPYIFEALAVEFDLDAASPDNKLPWIPARRHISSNSLSIEWDGFVWCNPPFGGRNGIAPWLDKFMAHGNGVCLTPDRTSAPWWQDAARKSDAVLFVAPKVRFLRSDGRPNKSPSTGTTLMARGGMGVVALMNAEANGLGLLMVRS